MVTGWIATVPIGMIAGVVGFRYGMAFWWTAILSVTLSMVVQSICMSAGLP